MPSVAGDMPKQLFPWRMPLFDGNVGGLGATSNSLGACLEARAFVLACLLFAVAVRDLGSVV